MWRSPGIDEDGNAKKVKKVKSDKLKTTSLLRANDKLSKVGTVHYTAYDGRGICEMSFEAILGPIFGKIEA